VSGRRAVLKSGGPRLQSFTGWITTFSLVCAGWYLFRAPSLADAWKGITSMVASHDFPLRKESFSQCPMRIGILLLIDGVTRDRGAPLWLLSQNAGIQIGALSVLLLAITAFVTKKGTQFIYFQF
jgi:hypothetical protein